MFRVARLLITFHQSLKFIRTVSIYPKNKMWWLSIVLLQLGANLISVVDSLSFRNKCLALDGGDIHTLHYDRSCIVYDSSQTDTRDKWATYCNHFPNGNLAIVFTNELIELLSDMLANLGLQNAYPYISPFQVNKTNEPAGNFIVDIIDGNKYDINPQTIMWSNTDPDNRDDDNECLVVHVNDRAVSDASCFTARTYICQYPENFVQAQYVQKARNKRMDPSLVFLEFQGVHLSKCAVECATRFICQSFSYSKNG